MEKGVDLMLKDFEIKRKVLIKYNGKSKNPVIPEGVKKIGPDAFASAKIETVSIPETVTEICENAFIGSDLKEVTIPKSVEHIGEGAFGLCEHLKTFTVLNGKINFGTKGINFVFCANKRLSEVNLPDDMPRATGFLSSAGKLKSIKLLPTETEIKPMAFYSCASLSEVIIPEGVTKIGASAFMDCTSLRKIVLPEGLTEIEDKAFSGCVRLKTVVIPKSLKKIGANSFEDCFKLGARTIAKLDKIEEIVYTKGEWY